jgi:hypothetical protein
VAAHRVREDVPRAQRRRESHADVLIGRGAAAATLDHMRLTMLTLAAALAGCDQFMLADSESSTLPPSPHPHEPTQSLLSAGVVSLAADHGTPLDVLHVRVTIAADGARPTTASTVTATVALPGEPPFAALAANADLPELPVTMVEPGDREAIDLYFPLAASTTPDSRYLFTWTLVTADGPMTLAETFAATPARPALVLGAARYWWFSSMFPPQSYRHQDGIITPEPPVGAEVRPTIIDDDVPPVTEECAVW